MKVTYSPEGGAVQSWDYFPAKVKQSQAEMIEKRAGVSWDEFNKAVLSGSARARKVLLWHCYMKDHPVFRWEDVPDFAMSEVQVSFDRAELETIRHAAASAKDMDDATKTAALAALDDELAKLEAVDEEGKVLSNQNESVSGP